MKRIKLGLIVLSIIAIVAAIAGCSGQKAGVEKNSSTADEQSKQATGETSAQNEAAKASEQKSDTNAPSADKKQYAVIETNKGKIVFQLFPNKAPKTVANFVKLANSGFFNGIKWHRVEPGFVIQGGDPLSKDGDPGNDGLGGPGYTIPAEINDVPHLRGTVAMAHNSVDINSAGSQFYICLTDQPRLNGQYTVFGQVSEGMDVVDQIRVGDIMNRVYIEER